MIAVASLGLLGLFPAPSFAADGYDGVGKTCGGSYLVNTWSTGYGGAYHTHYQGSLARKKSWTGNISVVYDRNYSSGWTSISGYRVHHSYAMFGWGSDCIN